MAMARARETGRGIRPRILMNGHAAAYSSFLRIRGIVTVSPGKIACQCRRGKASGKAIVLTSLGESSVAMALEAFSRRMLSADFDAAVKRRRAFLAPIG